MSFILFLLTLFLSLFFLNLFFQLARVEKGLLGNVALLEKFMILRYNLKKDRPPEENGEEVAKEA